MATSCESENSALFKWLSEYLHNLLFQPDDELAFNTFETCVAKDVTMKINHDYIPRQAYFEHIMDDRACHGLALISQKQLKVWEAPGGGGSIIYEGELVYNDKKTGEKEVCAFVMIADISKGDDGNFTIVHSTEMCHAKFKEN
ncbi:uncharacterized protein Triagg1_67 [Trichoderma aggressivum f. europaeum]|uniref:Uncharacterized protein n=1 Tax=Trichoderma aggressivum f. europaeum TaxID=173218 RepID=A0AAE1IJS0_9HYPO|nr:hypothetical protein Triagg1_67 [Trichoderma aggressivum f. europaeum]